MPIKTTCAPCKNFAACHVADGSGECAVWELQIKQGASVQQNANFYHTQLGGDNLYSNCAFIADETRDCLHFAGSYPFTIGD